MRKCVACGTDLDMTVASHSPSCPYNPSPMMANPQPIAVRFEKWPDDRVDALTKRIDALSKAVVELVAAEDRRRREDAEDHGFWPTVPVVSTKMGDVVKTTVPPLTERSAAAPFAGTFTHKEVTLNGGSVGLYSAALCGASGLALRLTDQRERVNCSACMVAMAKAGVVDSWWDVSAEMTAAQIAVGGTLEGLLNVFRTRGKVELAGGYCGHGLIKVECPKCSPRCAVWGGPIAQCKVCTPDGGAGKGSGEANGSGLPKDTAGGPKSTPEPSPAPTGANSGSSEAARYRDRGDVGYQAMLTRRDAALLESTKNLAKALGEWCPICDDYGCATDTYKGTV